MKKQLSIFVLGLVLGHAPNPARADELTEAAKKVFDEAVDAMEKRQWAICRTKAAGAWGQFKSPRIAAVLGLCEAELGLNRDAAEHFEFFLANAKDASPKQVTQIRDRLDLLKPKLARIRVKPTPSDAEVTINGELVGSGELTRFVDPGEINVSVAKNGQARSRTLTLRAGTEETAEIEVPIVSDGGGGTGGGAGGTGAGGAGGSGAGGTGGGDTTAEKPLWPTLVLAGVGAVGVASGIGLIVASSGEYDDASAQASCSPFTGVCEEAGRDALSRSDGLMSGAIVSFSIGGAALAAMAIWLAIPMGSSQIALLPVMSPSANGFVIKGNF